MITIVSVLVLGLVLHFAYWVGKLHGCYLAGELIVDLKAKAKAAQLEAAQCKFACKLFKHALENQNKKQGQS